MYGIKKYMPLVGYRKSGSILVLLVLVVVAVSAIASTKFYRTSGLVEIDVVLNGNIHGRFGLDTGADELYIDRAFAEKHNLEYAQNTRPSRAAGVNGTSDISYVDLESIKLDDKEYGKSRGTVIDLKSLGGSKSERTPDGLIGYYVLQQFLVSVDYPAGTISLESERPRFLNGKNYSEFAFDMNRHLILVDVTMPNGSIRPMILDYGASHTLIVPELAEELELSSSEGALHFLQSLALENPLQGKKVLVSNVGVVVQDLSSFNSSFGGTKAMGILGGSFLNNLRITINYKRQRFYIRY